MPLVWREMRMVDGQPEVGRAKNMLGVLVGPGAEDDIREHGGQVSPGTGGMSVSPTQDTLPLFRIPKRLREKYPDRFPEATGKNSHHCWSMGEGEFHAGPFAPDLVFRPDPDDAEKHGFVEPERETSVQEYEEAITATRPQWTRWEE